MKLNTGGKGFLPESTPLNFSRSRDYGAPISLHKFCVYSASQNRIIRARGLKSRVISVRDPLHRYRFYGTYQRRTVSDAVSTRNETTGSEPPLRLPEKTSASTRFHIFWSGRSFGLLSAGGYPIPSQLLRCAERATTGSPVSFHFRVGSQSHPFGITFLQLFHRVLL